MKKIDTPTISNLIENLQAIASISNLGMETPISVHASSCLRIQCCQYETKEGLVLEYVSIVGFDK